MAGAAPSKLRMRAKMASIVRGSVQIKYELLVCAFAGQLLPVPTGPEEGR